MLLNTGVAVGVRWFSNAQVCFAPSIWRRLLMQLLVWDVLRARAKLGIAIAAKRPIMATTIMISNSVKPDFRDTSTFILLLSFIPRRERGNRRVTNNTLYRSRIAHCQ